MDDDSDDAADSDEYKALAASSRAVRLRGEGRLTRFPREALDDMARQIDETCV